MYSKSTYVQYDSVKETGNYQKKKKNLHFSKNTNLYVWVYHGFLISLLDGVACDVTVAIILGWFPLQGNVEAPNIYHL